MITICTQQVITATNLHPIGLQPNAGMFFNFLGVLNHLRYAQKNQLKPIVFWPKPNLYYDENRSHETSNVWEYYFEPIWESSFDHNKQYIWNSNLAPDRTSIAPISLNNCDSLDHQALRDEMHLIIEKHIRLKPLIQHKIEAFYNKYMAGHKTIGIHLRGTDKKNEVKPVKTETILEDANAFARQFDSCQFLVATDEERLLNLAKQRLNGKVIYYDAQRSQDGKPIHYNNKQQKALLGEEVIIEAYLLSHTDLFLHTCSSVSIAILFLNPFLEHKMYKSLP